jgi:hypothetical protein
VHLDATEETGIAVVEHDSAGELEAGVAMRRGPRGGGAADPLAGHPEVGKEAHARVELEEEDLAAPIDPLEAAAGETTGEEEAAPAPEDTGGAGPGPDHGALREPETKGAGGVLDFR